MEDVKDDEFERAFNTDEAAVREAGEKAENLEDPVNTPSDDSPEGAAETAATAVTLGSADADITPDEGIELQREKSWEGRMKQRENELKALEAELAEKAALLAAASESSAEGDVIKAKDGVEVEAEGVASGTGLIDEVRDEAVELAKNPAELEKRVAQMIEDFGREHVVATLALTSPLLDKIAGPYADGIKQSLQEEIGGVIAQFNQALQDQHFASIKDAHEDVAEVIESDGFKAWLDSLGADKAAAEEVISDGTSGQVIKLLQRYKESVAPQEKAGEKSPEDIWAEDAASSVKGSSPLKIPKKTATTPDDEYSQAWAAL